MISQAVPPEAVTPTLMLAELRAERAAADRAEVRILQLAVAWAHAHPESPGDVAWHAPRPVSLVTGDGSPDPLTNTDEEMEWFGIPDVTWDAAASFAAALGMSTGAGSSLLRDALVLRHRLPQVWARVRAGDLQAWRARRVAQRVLGSPVDVVESIDTDVAPIAHKVGPITLSRMIEEAMVRLYPEKVELAQLAALDARHVTLYEDSINHTGVAYLAVRGDWADLDDFDKTVTRIAACVAADPDHPDRLDSLDARRSVAVGILADPAKALALLEARPAPAPTREIVAYVHLTSDHVAGRDPFTVDETGRVLLAEQVRAWCSRTDTHVTIKPVIDLRSTHPARHYATAAHQVPTRMAENVILRDRSCVFPWCTHRSRTCDLDHIEPWTRDPGGGPTTESNLAPLCRHHHRLKTHAGWSYTPIEPGTYLWTDPHGLQLLRDPEGTTDVSS